MRPLGSSVIVKGCVFILLVGLMTACGGSSSSGPLSRNGSNDSSQIENTAQEFLADINLRRFDLAVGLFSRTCKQGPSASDMEASWRTAGEGWGDPNYRLSLAQFNVSDVQGNQADVTATVNVTTSTEVRVIGTKEPFFERFAKEDGRWRLANPGC